MRQHDRLTSGPSCTDAADARRRHQAVCALNAGDELAQQRVKHVITCVTAGALTDICHTGSARFEIALDSGGSPHLILRWPNNQKGAPGTVARHVVVGAAAPDTTVAYRRTTCWRVTGPARCQMPQHRRHAGQGHGPSSRSLRRSRPLRRASAAGSRRVLDRSVWQTHTWQSSSCASRRCLHPRPSLTRTGQAADSSRWMVRSR